MTKLCRPQQGFAAVAAIFLVVVLAGLGSYMVSFSNTQQLTSAQDVQGTRAYWAARAGLEWGVAAVLAGNTPGGTTQECPSTPTNLTVQGFAVQVTCSVTNFTEAASTVALLRLASNASTGTAGTVGFVERNVSASMER